MNGISRLRLPKSLFLFFSTAMSSEKKLPQTLCLGYYFEFHLFLFVCSQLYSVIQLGNFSFSSSVRNSAKFLSF